jgi:ABC-type nitrate/sulfonate/bicarbonate transport system permease component
MRTKSLNTIISVVVFFILWELAVAIFHFPNWVLPAPSRIFAELFNGAPDYCWNALSTLFTTLSGFLLAFVVGTILAILIVYSRLIEAAIFSLLVSFNSIPKIIPGAFVRHLARDRRPSAYFCCIYGRFLPGCDQHDFGIAFGRP